MTADEARFADLYKTYFRHVYAYCYRRTGPDRADDAAAETFLVAWRKLDQAPQGSTVLPWLYGVAYGVVRNQWRGARRKHRLDRKLQTMGIDAVLPAESVVVLRDEATRMVQALRRLKEKEQEILRLSVWEELPHSDAALVLGISPEAVRQRLSRARKSLIREYDRVERSSNTAPAAQEGGAW